MIDIEREIEAIENACDEMGLDIETSEKELVTYEEQQRVLQKHIGKFENVLMQLRNALYAELANNDPANALAQSRSIIGKDGNAGPLIQYLLETGNEIDVEQITDPLELDLGILILEGMTKTKTAQIHDI